MSANIVRLRCREQPHQLTKVSPMTVRHASNLQAGSDLMAHAVEKSFYPLFKLSHASYT